MKKKWIASSLAQNQKTEKTELYLQGLLYYTAHIRLYSWS